MRETIADRPDQHAGGDGSSVWRFLDNLPAMVVYIDAEKRYGYANASYLARCNGNSVDIVGLSLRDVLGSQFTFIEPFLDQALRGGDVDFEAELPFPDGTRHHMQVFFSADTDRSGDVVGVYAYLQDVEAYRQVASDFGRFKLACDQGMEGFGLHDEGGNFVYVNPAQASMYGYSPEELTGASWKTFYGPEQIRFIEHYVFPALLRDGHWRGELLGMRKDATTFDVEVALTRIDDPNGSFSGLVCNCRDVTERNIAERSLRQLQKIDALGQLTGGIAHDFNNLLGVISGNLELIRQLAPAPDTRERHLDSALEAVSRGSALVNRLLGFAKKQQVQPVVVDAGQVLRDVHGMVAHAIGANISVLIQVDDDLWSTRVDPSQLENAIVNLAINSRDAMADGGVIELRAYNHCALDEVCIEVSDTGTGMPESVREQMFDPFFTTKRAGSGTGLGLSSVHGFIAQSQGRIEVTTAIDQGTVISLFFPRSLGSLPARETNAGATKECEGIPVGNGETVLLVDDDNAVLDVTSAMLTELGYRALCADTADAAIDLARANSIDLVLSDVLLRDRLDGPQLIEQIRSHVPTVVSLLMSGYHDSQLSAEQRSTLLVKPVRVGRLAAAISDALDSK